MMHKAWCSMEEVPYCFSRSSGRFQCHTGQQSHPFCHNLSVCGLELQFEFTDGFEMMHKAWCSVEEVLYCLSRSSIKFQVHAGWKIDDLNSILVRLLGWLQLSSPSDLPCSSCFRNFSDNRLYQYSADLSINILNIVLICLYLVYLKYAIE